MFDDVFDIRNTPRNFDFFFFHTNLTMAVDGPVRSNSWHTKSSDAGTSFKYLGSIEYRNPFATAALFFLSDIHDLNACPVRLLESICRDLDVTAGAVAVHVADAEVPVQLKVFVQDMPNAAPEVVNI